MTIKIDKAWLTGETFAGTVCRRSPVTVKRSFEQLPRAQQPNGVLHTTEGHWAGSLSVFANSTGTPTFMLGWNEADDNNGKGEGPFRVVQFMPLGEMALTLVNDAGGTETNREALVQIEVIAFSKKAPWLFDKQTTETLAALMDRLEEVCGIPLQRAGNGSRSVALWDGKAGWFGHGEVPENGHWDPGNLKLGRAVRGGAERGGAFLGGVGGRRAAAPRALRRRRRARRLRPAHHLARQQRGQGARG